MEQFVAGIMGVMGAAVFAGLLVIFFVIWLLVGFGRIWHYTKQTALEAKQQTALLQRQTSLLQRQLALMNEGDQPENAVEPAPSAR